MKDVEKYYLIKKIIKKNISLGDINTLGSEDILELLKALGEKYNTDMGVAKSMLDNERRSRICQDQE